MRFMTWMLVGTTIACTAGAALAQSNPSADQLIKALKPMSATDGTTRGIRPAAPAGAVAASEPAAQPSIGLHVQFASDSAELSPAARATLDQLGRALSSSDLAGYKFRIEGHTDTVGSVELNQALSERRADAVVGYLIANYHVAPSRLQPVGLGSSQPAVPTGPQVDEPRNRRVQVVNIGP
jgi:outer membrane protein OmpA-like peptidoglycan-associated protein